VLACNVTAFCGLRRTSYEHPKSKFLSRKTLETASPNMSTNITQLSTTIAENVNDIRNLFVSRNTDEPTWDGDIPPSFHFDQDYTSLRKTTLKACKQLIAVLQHPWEVITNRTVSRYDLLFEMWLFYSSY
jgi:hypothetical protein